jgi:transposase-like protein
MEMSSEVQSFLDIFYRCKRRVSAFLIDETIIQIGFSNEALLWVVVEPTLRQILGVYISRHRNNMIVIDGGISQFINKNL